jgi:hypothetical protein
VRRPRHDREEAAKRETLDADDAQLELDLAPRRSLYRYRRS